mgnify:FL=1
MEDLNKRLVEIEYILRKLEDEYIKKIPQEIWDYIEKNKDKNYIFKYDDSKNLLEQNLNIDTISILTYINIEYLLDEKQKMEMIEFLRKDEAIAEQKKAKLYNTEDLFKNKKESKQQETSLVEVKIEKWYEKVFAFFKNMFKK